MVDLWVVSSAASMVVQWVARTDVQQAAKRVGQRVEMWVEMLVGWWVVRRDVRKVAVMVDLMVAQWVAWRVVLLV